ncbi:MAG: chemotaxis-specific protein-glutamate methyltransferase CheB [Candidatus Wallbacteria bacterium]
MSTNINIILVDDSVISRRMIINAVSTVSDTEKIEITNFAASAEIGIIKLTEAPPNVILLDIDMPETDGIEALKIIKKLYPAVAVIMLAEPSVIILEKAKESIALGADDYAVKPANMNDLAAVNDFLRLELVPKIKKCSKNRTNGLTQKNSADKILSGTDVTAETAADEVFYPNIPPSAAEEKIKFENENEITVPDETAGSLKEFEILAIGVSTGGPKALEIFFSKLKKDLSVPIVIVQHMPSYYTGLLATRLTQETGHLFFEGYDGAMLTPGKIWIAPGDYHMTVRKIGRSAKIFLNQDEPENSCRPSVDVLFRSVALEYAGKSLAVILTGMGQDGLIGCNAIKKSGGRIIVQNKETCAVWGMPKAVFEAGIADDVLPLEKIPVEINNFI